MEESVSDFYATIARKGILIIVAIQRKVPLSVVKETERAHPRLVISRHLQCQPKLAYSSYLTK